MSTGLILSITSLAGSIIALITAAIWKYLLSKKKITLEQFIALYGDNIYTKCPSCRTELKLSSLSLYTKEH